MYDAVLVCPPLDTVELLRWCGWVVYAVKSFNYLTVKSFFLINISDFVVLLSLSLPRVFYFENWLGALCRSAVWLPVWFNVLCAAWHGYVPLSSEIYSVHVLCWAERRALLRVCWNVKTQALSRTETGLVECGGNNKAGTTTHFFQTCTCTD